MVLCSEVPAFIVKQQNATCFETLSTMRIHSPLHHLLHDPIECGHFWLDAWTSILPGTDTCWITNLSSSVQLTNKTPNENRRGRVEFTGLGVLLNIRNRTYTGHTANYANRCTVKSRRRARITPNDEAMGEVRGVAAFLWSRATGKTIEVVKSMEGPERGDSSEVALGVWSFPAASAGEIIAVVVVL